MPLTSIPQAVGRDKLNTRAAELQAEDFVNEEYVLGLCLLLVYTDHAQHTIHRHIAAFAEALGLSELTQETGESTPLSPRSPKAGSNIKLASRRSSGFFGSNAQDDSAKRNGGLSPAISTRGGRTATQVEKVQALSDFAPIHQRVSRYELGVMISWTTI
jgi:hypothetical protein